MGQMDAVTWMELEAARRREVVLDDVAAARVTRHWRRDSVRRQAREPAWTTAALAALLGTVRLVRG